MALSEQYESTIESVQAYFGFSGFECDPQEITLALGIEPTDVRRVGDVRCLPRGREFRVPFHSWSIESCCESKDINVHLRQLLQQLNGKETLIRLAWSPTFSILWKGTALHSGNGPFFERDVLAGIVRCGAELWQDIYQLNIASETD